MKVVIKGMQKRYMSKVIGTLLDGPNLLCPHEFYTREFEAMKGATQLKDNIVQSFVDRPDLGYKSSMYTKGDI